ncbi:MAG TPA: hypothetical protein VF030_09035 [Solirubrobacterales bacterium]
MHDQRQATSAEVEDLRDEMAVLTHVLVTHPGVLRLPDLLRELGHPEDFGERDRTERAVASLIRTGLLFRCQDAVLPTRSALRAYEVLSS